MEDSNPDLLLPSPHFVCSGLSDDYRRAPAHGYPGRLARTNLITKSPTQVPDRWYHGALIYQR